jgi:hypothetical protein
MNIPLPFLVLAATDTTHKNNTCEIYLNRSGINSIEVPRGNARAECGGDLRLKFVNRGAPLHITVTSTNAGMFTDFFHENLFIVDETILTIRIREDSAEGFFDIGILAGYGIMKAEIRVDVYRGTVQGQKATVPDQPIHPEAHGRPHLLMVSMGIGLILYIAWFYSGIEFLNIIAFITLIVGALYVWYRQQ